MQICCVGTSGWYARTEERIAGKRRRDGKNEGVIKEQGGGGEESDQRMNEIKGNKNIGDKGQKRVMFQKVKRRK